MNRGDLKISGVLLGLLFCGRPSRTEVCVLGSPWLTLGLNPVSVNYQALWPQPDSIKGRWEEHTHQQVTSPGSGACELGHGSLHSGCFANFLLPSAKTARALTCAWFLHALQLPAGSGFILDTPPPPPHQSIVQGSQDPTQPQQTPSPEFRLSLDSLFTGWCLSSWHCKAPPVDHTFWRLLRHLHSCVQDSFLG